MNCVASLRGDFSDGQKALAAHLQKQSGAAKNSLIYRRWPAVKDLLFLPLYVESKEKSDFTDSNCVFKKHI